MSGAQPDIDQMSPGERRALLRQLLASGEGTPMAPASFAQQRLWILDRLDPGRPLYTISRAYRLRGALDVDALRAALGGVASRHEVLRTTFADGADGPVQIVAPSATIDMPLIDLSDLPQAEGIARMQAIYREEARRPFDLVAGPLLRPGLVRLRADDHVLMLVHHHIISDAWSLRLLLQELAAAYGGQVHGTPWRPEPLTLQFGDYARSQRQSLRGERLASLVKAWSRALDGAPPVLELPTDRPRPAVPTHRGATVTLSWGSGLAERLQALARAEGVTPFMVLLAAFQSLLSRWSGQRDVVVGSPVAGRTDPSLEPLVGFFVNTLALRATVDEGTSFRTLLRHVRDICLEAFTHQELPFERLVEDLGLERDLSRNPLFQVMFIYQSVDEGEFRMPGIDVEPIEVDNGIAKFDLTLCVEEAETSIEGWLEYSLDLFDEPTANGLLEQLQLLLDNALADPDVAVDRLSLMTAEQRRALVVGNDRTGHGQPSAPFVHQLVSEQARRTPDAVAVTSQGENLTYVELEAWGTAVAATLAELDVRRRPVAVMAEVGFPLVVALLAVAKAGAHWLCLQPDDPPERQAHVLDELQPVAVLLDQAGAASWVHGSGIATVDVAGSRAHAGSNRTPPVSAVAVLPEDPVYVVYTSGSTGVPKGIVQPHHSFAQFVEWMGQHFDLAGRRAAHWAAVTYDAAYCEIFAPLVSGATLCLAPDRVRRDPEALLVWVRSEGVQWLQLVPSVARQLLGTTTHTGPDALPLEDLLLAGEPLPAKLAGELLRRLPTAGRLYNLYGPTECVLATWHRVSGPGEGIVPVGRPIDGRHVLVVDGVGELCPPGVVGEVVVRSPYLSHGYHGRPEETRAAFADDAPAGLPGPSYRTGDLGRWRHDGTLEFRGRRDQQVKVHGVRMELQEVEAALSRHEAVAESAVVAVPSDNGGGAQLIAYVELAAGAETVGDLRGALRRWLPEAAVPVRVMVLDRLPRTNSGKVDRPLLPLPKPGDIDGSPVEFGSEREREVAAIWCEVVQVDCVAPDANFFAVGGNSLTATQVLNRVRDRLGADVPLRRFFEVPTVAALAQLVDEEMSGTGTDDLAALVAEISDLSEDDTRTLLAERQDGG